MALHSNGISNTGGTGSSTTSSSHAVSRSNELLACAKTTYKVYYQKQEQERLSRQGGDPSAAVRIPPNKMPSFRLSSPSDPSPESLVVLEDGLTLLRSMEYGLKQLKVLVRRRGATNDPTNEIATLVKQLEQDTSELTEFCEGLLKIRRRKQAKRHWELVVEWFQHVAMTYSSQLQECLKLRSEILAEQAHQRRKLVDNKQSSVLSSLKAASRSGEVGAVAGGRIVEKNGTAAASSHRAAGSQLFDSPLFSSPPPQQRNKHQPPPPQQRSTYPTTTMESQHQSQNCAVTATTTVNSGENTTQQQGGGGGPSSSYPPNCPPRHLTARISTTAVTASGYGGTSSYYGGGGSGAAGYGGSAGYGGAAAGVGASMGMRQRRGGGGINGDGGRVGGGYYYGGGGGLSTIPIAEQEEEEKIHTKIQMRQQKRQTQQRLEEAQEAETMLGELGQMFGKMSTLISQQGEVLEKIEDDAELALTDVTAGQEELTKLYGLKKGNRPLIIKTFLILNFLIIFMKAYSKR